MEATSVSGSKGTVISEKGQFRGIRIENPFTLKVGQIFTGFGVGCGVGIGVGRPINMGAIPVMNELMSATRGATDAFSGITRHLNNSEIRSYEHPSWHWVWSWFWPWFWYWPGYQAFISTSSSLFCDAMEKVMTKLGNNPSLPISQGAVPVSLQSASSMTNASENEHPIASIRKIAKEVPGTALENLSGYRDMSKGSTLQNALSSRSYGTRTEKVIDSFLQNPVFKGEDTELKDEVGRLRLENHLFQMVIMHQKLIQELREENNKLHQILVEDLKIPPSKLQASNIGRNIPPCSDCFECRRKQRRRRS
ncbi:uncharacterized protein LOC103503467 isoform X8 [Cucumis melo]|uniref:Uncharacterized protein LOC103503467 isoform X7 n=1 Tax=Cucumis melo TaxID=3656 RepID=A0A1S3CPY7_CUCME|nr:uncharacterized protein LOC103503467 isoform X7 [Cucumis melo]XP_050939411.1 uncharacterized protein LOC103503467 isoform X8 [Cucumis melo]